MSDTRQSDPRTPLLIAFVSLIALMLASGGHYVAVVAMVPISESMNWPRSVPSTAYALTLLGMGAGGILMGRWSDRAGVARPVAFASVCIFAGAVWASHATTAWEFLLANGYFKHSTGTLDRIAF